MTKAELEERVRELEDENAGLKGEVSACSEENEALIAELNEWEERVRGVTGAFNIRLDSIYEDADYLLDALKGTSVDHVSVALAMFKNTLDAFIEQEGGH